MCPRARAPKVPNRLRATYRYGRASERLRASPASLAPRAPRRSRSSAVPDAGVSGVAVAIGVIPLSGETGSVWGQLAIVLATLFYALAGVWGRVRLSSYQAVQGACGMLLCSAVLSVPLALLLSGQPSVSLLQSAHLGTLVVLILGIGLLGTAMAYPLYFKVLELAGASNLLLVTIIVPVFALSLDALLLGQLVSWSAMAGFGLVAFGLSVMDGRLYHRKDRSDSL